MNYIILDLEWNQAISVARMIRKPVMLHGEIIQIGAVKTDENFNLQDKIRLSVRPMYYKKMNPHVERLTGITQEQLTCGLEFPKAFEMFKKWCGDNFRFITWGFDDVGVFSDNLTLHGLDPSFGSNYINLQLIYNRQTKSEHLQCALAAAAESMGIPIDVQCHDALNDAYLTYELCRSLDMTLGIAEYAEYAAALPVPLAKDAVNNIRDLKTMLYDKRVTDISCPKCGGKLKHGQWLFSSGKSCKTISNCPADGNFLIKLKAVKISDSSYTVMRTVFSASDEETAAFNEKIAQRKERRKKLAAQGNGGQNDKNSNV